MSVLDPTLARLRDHREALLALRPRIEAGAPWAPAERFGTEPEASWGPGEVLAHLAEMLPYWLGEIERIVAGTPEPVPFGRTQDDVLRIGIVGRDRTLPVRELYARIAADLDRIERRLGGLNPGELGRRGLHPVRGELTIPEIAERMICSHVGEHVEQLRGSLDPGGTAA